MGTKLWQTGLKSSGLSPQKQHSLIGENYLKNQLLKVSRNCSQDTQQMEKHSFKKNLFNLGKNDSGDSMLRGASSEDPRLRAQPANQ